MGIGLKFIFLCLTFIAFTGDRVSYGMGEKPKEPAARVQEKISAGMPEQPYETIIIPGTAEQVTGSRMRDGNMLHLSMYASQEFAHPPDGHRYEVWWGTTLEKESRYVFAGFLQRDKDQTWKLWGFPVEDSRHTLNQVVVFTAPMDEPWKMADHPSPLGAKDHALLFSGEFPHHIQTE